MKARLLVWLGACLATSVVVAEPWSFEPPLTVTLSSHSPAVFHHLDSSGRRNIAVSGDTLAIAWEDDRDGTPRVYLAHKQSTQPGFSKALQISGAGEAYEPSMLALTGQRFALAWEEDGQVWFRVVEIDPEPRLGPMTKVSQHSGAQASLVAAADGVWLLWSGRAGRFGQITVAKLLLDDLSASIHHHCSVDAQPPQDEQLYPSGAILQGRLVAVWEDRRPKHTIIMAAVSEPEVACRFAAPVRISEEPPGEPPPYGAGHGVARVAIDRLGEDRLFAAWADKRHFRDGYDIWGAFYAPTSMSFAANQRVQDDFGGLSKQHHAAVAGNAYGTLAVAWSDEREGHADIMLSWYHDGEWSDDWSVPVASGPGQQSNPSMTLDDHGNLHLAWVERDEIGGPTRLRYALGRVTEH